MTGWDADRAVAYYDELGEREWTRFEDGRTPPASLDLHTRMLERFVRPGDRVLDAGAGPGRFTIELARLGADVVALDISPGQLDLHRERVEEAGLEDRVVERVVGDVTDLSRFSNGSFDVAVCFGGPLSYVLDRAEDAVAELVRVTRRGGHVLVSVMSVAGAVLHFLPQILDLARRDGVARQEQIVATGHLPAEPDYGHLEMHLYRWHELEALLSRHGRIVAAAAAGLLPDPVDAEEPIRDLVRRLDLQLAEEPGVVDCGQHIVAVLEVA